MISIKRKTYYVCLFGTCILMILALGFGLTTGNPLFIGAIITIACIAAYGFHRHVNEVMTDDLSDVISGKAAVRTVEITAIITAIGFAIALTFFFTGGWGSGMHTYENGSARVNFMQFYPVGTMIHEDHIFIPDTKNLSGDDILAMERLFGAGYRVRDGPFYMGLGFGLSTLLLAGLFAIFSMYYDKKYGT